MNKVKGCQSATRRLDPLLGALLYSLMQPGYPRYSDRPFPSYRYRPGELPHPRRDPKGHSYGKPEPQLSAFKPDAWDDAGAYLYAVDLYNHGYFWECHEIFEALWNAFGHDTTAGRLFKGLVQLAAANLKRAQGRETAARALAGRGLTLAAQAPDGAFGLPIAAFVSEARAYFERGSARFPRIHLVLPPWKVPPTEERG